MTKKIFSFVLAAMLLLIGLQLIAQVGINDHSGVPDNSAMLDVSSASKGFLPPRMTTAQRDAIQTPAEGLTIYNTDLKCIEFYAGSANGWHSPCLSFGTISCAGPVVSGVYMERTPLSAANTVSVTLTNATAGGYNISTNTVNGFRFSKMGTFTSIGSHLVVLNGSGIPDTAGIATFNVTYGNSSCTFNVSVEANPLGQPCPGTPTVTHGGKTYNTVQIGTQCWFKENLNIGTRIDGTQEQTNNSIIEKYCYDNLESNCDVYGGLYQWNELMQYETADGAPGLCPSGWHIPTHSEWSTLVSFLGGESIAGGKLKETGFSHWQSPNTGATNETGYTALPGGLNSTANGFGGLGNGATFWTSTKFTWGLVGYRHLVSYGAMVYSDNGINENNGNSARCLKNPCTVPDGPTSAAHVPSQTQIIWNWNAVPGATGYKWNTIDEYASATDMGTTTTKTETGLTCNSNYARYAWAYNSCGNSTPVLLTQTTSSCPPASGMENFTNYLETTNVYRNGTFLGQDGSSWLYYQCRGDSVIAAPSPTLGKGRTPTAEVTSGTISNGCGTLSFDYKQVFSSGVALNVFVNGNLVYTATTSGEQGIVKNSGPVTVNVAGNFILDFKQQSTTSGQVCIDNISYTSYFSCGNPFIINHLEGTIAPVTKTVTYGTVTNIPGEPTKCWITSNLGADHQATSVDDATEASAGWYWQFNRKQGFKHNGTTRTPGTTWITAINENLDWEAINDPCTLELGMGWRIPTDTEWSSIIPGGGWTNWNDPWNSVLKLHAAGFIYYSDGLLNDPGQKGFYWSSSQNGSGGSRNFYVQNSSSGMNTNSKAMGFSLRCLKDN